MTKQRVILLLSLGLTACGKMNTIPLDDAYIWPEKQAPKTEVAQPESQSQYQSQGPSIEYVSVQDTTITVRIKK